MQSTHIGHSAIKLSVLAADLPLVVAAGLIQQADNYNVGSRRRSAALLKVVATSRSPAHRQVLTR